MIAALPPAYYQPLVIEDRRRSSSAYSDDALSVSSMLMNALDRLRSTPASTFAAAINDENYPSPGPQSKRTMRVKFKFIGAGVPLPFDEELEGE